MGYVFLGHGELDVQAGAIPAGMEIVAIPDGTTIQFYADAGTRLHECHIQPHNVQRHGGLGRGADSIDFVVGGVPAAKQGVVEAAIARFSDKTVNFV